MNIFRRPDYRSDTTEFLNAMKVQKPELEAQQRQGRSLLWDKSLDHADLDDMQKGRVAQQPYVYQTSSK